MLTNVMNEYINLNKKHITDYMKLIFDNRLNKKIHDEYLKKYIEFKYYSGIEHKKNNILKSKILSELKTTRDELLKYYIDKKEDVRNIYFFYEHIIYIDGMLSIRNIESRIDKLYELRKKILKRETERFKEEFISKLNDNKKEQEDFIEKHETDEFYLKFSNYYAKDITQRVILKYNFKMPMIYSNLAIERAFNEGITKEDKLIIEYYLISIQVIKDIIKRDLKKQYIIEFANTLFSKKQKAERILGIIENQVIQERISIKLKYEDFEKNREYIYSLMRKGFRIAIILDSNFNVTLKNIETLKMFSYILVSQNLEFYDELMKNGEILEKAIII